MVLKRLLKRSIFKELVNLQRCAIEHKHAQMKWFEENYVKKGQCLIAKEDNLKQRQSSNTYQPAMVIIPNAFKQVTTGRWRDADMVSLYTRCHTSSGRPYQVWVYDHRNHGNKLIFEEKDISCTVDVSMTRDEDYITINSNSRTSSEVHVLRSHDVSRAPPTCVRPRKECVEYYIDHAHNRFYIFTNLGDDKEYKIMTAGDEEELCSGQWKVYFEPRDELVLQDMELYSNHVVVYGLKDLLPVAMVMDIHDSDDNESLTTLSREDCCYIDKTIAPQEFDSSAGISVWFSSPVSPPSLQVYDNRENITFKSSSKSSESGPTTIERVHTSSKDGNDVPITLIYQKNQLCKNGNNPLLIQVYGCYGENIYMGYQPEMQYLVERGWVLAYCHVRGGGERGRQWYYEGRGRKKWNTIEDLHACVSHLQTTLCLSRPHLTVMSGRSAGGLAVGIFCNQWPQLIQAALLQVPFVNVMDSLLDSSLYLSNKDYDEFGGNPRESEEEHKAVSSICPYSTLKPQDYPAMFISASTVDQIVPFEGIEKYVDKLKQCIESYQNNSHKHTRHLHSHDNIAHATAAGGGGGLSGLLKRGLMSCSSSEVSRGSVVFVVDEKYDHFGSDNLEEQLTEAAVRINFMNDALKLSKQFQ